MFREASKPFNSSPSKEVFGTFSICFLGLIASSIHLILREDSHHSWTSRWKQGRTTRRRSCKKSQRLHWALNDENIFTPHRLRRSRAVTHLVFAMDLVPTRTCSSAQKPRWIKRIFPAPVGNIYSHTSFNIYSETHNLIIEITFFKIFIKKSPEL